MGRLTIDITDEQHKRLKAIAAWEGKSIKAYVLERMLPPAPDLNADDNEAWEEFKGFINKRIYDGLAHPESWRAFDDVWPDDQAFDKAA